MSTASVVTTEQRLVELEALVKHLPGFVTDKCAGLHKEISRIEDLLRQIRQEFKRAVGDLPPPSTDAVIPCDAMPGEEQP